MIFQVALSIALSCIVAYALTQRAKSRLVSTVALLASAAGIFLVWQPSDANAIAAFVGIGRGADLILYCWVIISLVLFLNLHLKMRADHAVLTDLVRHIAISETLQRFPVRNGAQKTGPTQGAPSTPQSGFVP